MGPVTEVRVRQQEYIVAIYWSSMETPLYTLRNRGSNVQIPAGLTVFNPHRADEGQPLGQPTA